MNAQSIHKKWYTHKSAVFEFSLSLPPFVSVGMDWSASRMVRLTAVGSFDRMQSVESVDSPFTRHPFPKS